MIIYHISNREYIRAHILRSYFDYRIFLFWNFHLVLSYNSYFFAEAYLKKNVSTTFSVAVEAISSLAALKSLSDKSNISVILVLASIEYLFAFSLRSSWFGGWSVISYWNVSFLYCVLRLWILFESMWILASGSWLTPLWQGKWDCYSIIFRQDGKPGSLLGHH